MDFAHLEFPSPSVCPEKSASRPWASYSSFPPLSGAFPIHIWSRLPRGMLPIIPKASAPFRVVSPPEFGSTPYEVERRCDWLGIRRQGARGGFAPARKDRKSTRLNSSHPSI